jgi:hypothetical protein
LKAGLSGEVAVLDAVHGVAVGGEVGSSAFTLFRNTAASASNSASDDQ